MNEKRSGWAVGYAAFAAVMLMLAGGFHFIAGLAGVLEDDFYVVTPNWVFEFDATVWGWIHLIGGVLVILAGLSILKGHMYGRIIGITVASISASRELRVAPLQGVLGRADHLPRHRRHLGTHRSWPRHRPRLSCHHAASAGVDLSEAVNLLRTPYYLLDERRLVRNLEVVRGFATSRGRSQCWHSSASRHGACSV